MFAAMIAGFVMGVIATAGVMVVVMRVKMLVRHTSRFEFKETVKRVESAILDTGWSIVDSKRLNDSLAVNGVAFHPRIQLIKLCKAEYAADVLSDNRWTDSVMKLRQGGRFPAGCMQDC